MLTDGDNTQAWKNSNNTNITSQTAIDARTTLVCSNIKAANIKLYTIRVINGNASLLRDCATNPNMYYDVQQAGELNVFSARSRRIWPIYGSPNRGCGYGYRSLFRWKSVSGRLELVRATPQWYRVIHRSLKRLLGPATFPQQLQNLESTCGIGWT